MYTTVRAHTHTHTHTQHNTHTLVITIMMRSLAHSWSCDHDFAKHTYFLGVRVWGCRDVQYDCKRAPTHTHTQHTHTLVITIMIMIANESRPLWVMCIHSLKSGKCLLQMPLVACRQIQPLLLRLHARA